MTGPILLIPEFCFITGKEAERFTEKRRFPEFQPITSKQEKEPLYQFCIIHLLNIYIYIYRVSQKKRGAFGRL